MPLFSSVKEAAGVHLWLIDAENKPPRHCRRTFLLCLTNFVHAVFFFSSCVAKFVGAPQGPAGRPAVAKPLGNPPLLLFTSLDPYNGWDCKVKCSSHHWIPITDGIVKSSALHIKSAYIS